jgi:hypothetical protein
MEVAVEWQYGQTGATGKRRREQASQRWKRSAPSAPACQKNAFSPVTRGSGLAGVLLDT